MVVVCVKVASGVVVVIVCSGGRRNLDCDAVVHHGARDAANSEAIPEPGVASTDVSRTDIFEDALTTPREATTRHEPGETYSCLFLFLSVCVC